ASRATARTVAGEEIERAAAAARALCRRFAEWPETAPAGEHLAQIAALLAEDLGWTAGPERTKVPDPVALAQARMEREIPPGFRLHVAELRLLFARALAEAGRAPLGGRGGGVQVLSV